MNVTPRLLTLLLAFCSSHGVSPDTQNAWHAWKTFKSFARATGEVPDPGVTVQLLEHEDGRAHLVLARQTLLGNGEWLDPTGAVVWELTFNSSVVEGTEEEIWSLDFPSFDDFVDAVEQNEMIAPLLTKEASDGKVYWEAARE